MDLIKSYYSAVPIFGRRFVLQLADTVVGPAIANTSKIFGISGHLDADAGAPCDVHHAGIAELVLGGKVACGDLLTSDAAGAGVELSAAMLAVSSARCGAMALQAGVAGDIIRVLVVTQLVSALDGLTATIGELDKLSNAPFDIDFTIGDEAANAITVAVQLNNAAGAALAARSNLYAYLSDDEDGDSIVADAPDGGIAAGTDGFLDPVTAGKSFRFTSEVDGDFDLVITHAGGAKTVYLIVVLPNGKLVASGAIAFAAE